MRKTERAKLTPQVFYDMLTEIARANPRRRNTDDGPYGGCVYTDTDGRHCLICEFLAIHDRRGLPKVTSPLNNRGADTVLLELGYTPEVATLAAEIQMDADGCSDTWLQAVRNNRWGVAA